MKKMLLLAAVVFAIGSTLAWGSAPIAVENGSFELPGLEKYKCWDGEDPCTVDVPGWTSDDNPVDCGVEIGWVATDGTWTAFLKSGDPSVWQVTDHVIAANEILTLQVDAKNNWAATTLQISLFAYDEITDPMDPNIVIPVRMPICVQNAALAYAMQTFTLECFTIDVPEAAGHKLGIELMNVSSGNAWLNLDNVRLTTSASTGVNVIVVTNTRDNDGDGVQDDWNLVEWLLREGHTVDFRPSYWTSFNPVDPCDPTEVPKIDQLDAADLVIASRALDTGAYDDGDEPTLWNSVQTPILNLHVWLARSNRWKWMNSTAATKTPGPTLLQAVDLNHPIFDGVTLEQLNIVDPNDLIDPNDPNAPIVLPDPIYGTDILDPTVGIDQTSFMDTLDVGNGKLIAQTYESNMTWIAEWKSAVEYYDGAGQIAGDHRMVFSAGAQEIEGSIQGALNLNSEGLQMLRNAISYMLAQPLPAREFQPASGAVDIPVDGTLSWRHGKLAIMYKVYLSDNKDAVANGTALVDVVADNSFSLAPLGLILGTTYYWRIDATDGVDTWPGEVLSFTTVDFLSVDDFESYADGNIGNIWIDGWTRLTGIKTGSNIAPGVNTEVVHSGSQSMALPYDTSKNPFVMQVRREWSGADWTKAGAKSLVIYFYGDPGNAAEDVWVRINGRKIVYNGGGLQKAEWTQWNISLNGLGIRTWKIICLDFGVGDPAAPVGRPGILYMDDIRLYRVTP